MYYTHGDTVIYRSNQPGASSFDQRWRGRERESRRPGRSIDRSTEQVLAERVVQLETRLAQLEAELAEARRRPPVNRSATGGAAPLQSSGGEVRVSVHADGGNHATVGEVTIR